MWLSMVVEVGGRGQTRVNRINYELGLLWMLRERLRATEIWVERSHKYGNPDHLLPADFYQKRDDYLRLLGQPMSAEQFVQTLQNRLSDALMMLDNGLPTNHGVKIRSNGWIVVSPLVAQVEPTGLRYLKEEISR